MLWRKAYHVLEEHFSKEKHKALLLTGARQVGKTYLIRAFAKKKYEHYVEINFIENKLAAGLLSDATGSQDILLRLSTLSKEPLVKGKTLICFDEIQECKEIATAIKFLVEEGSYDYVLSGSLLGVELNDLRSVPLGYMDILEMYPLDLEEFCLAAGVNRQVLEVLKTAFFAREKIDELIHNKMLEVFRLYLVVGGMPAVVTTYLEQNNLQEVLKAQRSINTLYKKDIGKYDREGRIHLSEIYELIPSQLNSKNKKFTMNKIQENFKFSRYEYSFIWLADAGVALPTYCVAEPVVPLLMSREKNSFKLFMADVGLLMAMYGTDAQVKILRKDPDINYGSIYENVAAQELKAHGFKLFYYNSKKQGEVDFVVEYRNSILPIEIKSGKGYYRHIALNNILQISNYHIPEGIVFSEENLYVKEKIVYAPIYMLMFLQKDMGGSMIYKFNPDILGKV